MNQKKSNTIDQAKQKIKQQFDMFSNKGKPTNKINFGALRNVVKPKIAPKTDGSNRAKLGLQPQPALSPAGQVPPKPGQPAPVADAASPLPPVAPAAQLSAQPAQPQAIGPAQQQQQMKDQLMPPAGQLPQMGQPPQGTATPAQDNSAIDSQIAALQKQIADLQAQKK